MGSARFASPAPDENLVDPSETRSTKRWHATQKTVFQWNKETNIWYWTRCEVRWRPPTCPGRWVLFKVGNWHVKAAILLINIVILTAFSCRLDEDRVDPSERTGDSRLPRFNAIKVQRSTYNLAWFSGLFQSVSWKFRVSVEPWRAPLLIGQDGHS